MAYPLPSVTSRTDWEERVRPPARKSLWLGEVRGNLSYHHPHLNPPPCLRRSGFAQAGIKGEESFLENQMPRSSLWAGGCCGVLHFIDYVLSIDH